PKLKAAKALLQIVNQIIGMFESDGETQQVQGAAGGRAFGGSTMLDQAMGAAEAGGVAEELESCGQFECFILPAFYLDGHHAAEPRHLRRGDLVAGMAGEAGIVNGFDPGLFGEKFSNTLRAGRLRAYAIGKRL